VRLAVANGNRPGFGRRFSTRPAKPRLDLGTQTQLVDQPVVKRGAQGQRRRTPLPATGVAGNDVLHVRDRAARQRLRRTGTVLTIVDQRWIEVGTLPAVAR
jgi:hypothetical protein